MDVKIFVDVDGCIANIYDEMAYRAKIDGWRTNPYKWKFYEFEKNHKNLTKEWISKQFIDPAFWLNAIPYEDAWHMINKWFHQGRDIYPITCRKKECLTERWLSEWQIPYNQLLDGQKKGEKIATIAPYMVDSICFFIEDDPHEAEIAGEICPTFLRNMSYNKDHKTEWCDRAISFYEIDKAIDRWLEEFFAQFAGKELK